jgi:hypothetical protein
LSFRLQHICGSLHYSIEAGSKEKKERSFLLKKLLKVSLKERQRGVGSHNGKGWLEGTQQGRVWTLFLGFYQRREGMIILTGILW